MKPEIGFLGRPERANVGRDSNNGLHSSCKVRRGASTSSRFTSVVLSGECIAVCKSSQKCQTPRSTLAVAAQPSDQIAGDRSCG